MVALGQIGQRDRDRLLAACGEHGLPRGQVGDERAQRGQPAAAWARVGADTAGRRAGEAADPDPSWFLRVLTSPPPGGVRSDPGPGGHGLTTLGTLVADLTAGEAVFAARGEHPVAIPLRDLAEGNPSAQRRIVQY